MKRLLLLAVTVWIALSCSAQPQPKPEILIVGTYHMNNPGRDVHNMKADDVLSDKRQQEMTQLIEVLKKFRPTKIAIEADVDSDKVPERYKQYLDGKYTLTRNEIDQIGLRLAKELGHQTVYPVDVDGDFPYMRLMNYVKGKGQFAKFEEISKNAGAEVEKQGAYLQSHTILETLVYMNSEEHVQRDMDLYLQFAKFGESGDYAGPDLLASWFQRNIRIYRNIAALAESPKDRVLVIYGAGHLGWLQQDVENDQQMKLRKLSEFVDKK